jgi:hypothetical protein
MSREQLEAMKNDEDLDRDESDFHIHRKPNPLFGPPPSIVENVYFSRIGHTFAPLQGSPGQYMVQDFLVDQTGASGADGKMDALKGFDLTTTTRYRLNVFPRDRTKRIKVIPSSGPVFMGLNMGRESINPVSDVVDMHTPISFFQFLVGTIPLTYNGFFITRTTNHAIHFQINASVSAPVEFFAFTAIGNYPPRSFDPGTKSYQPYSTGTPFNLPAPNPVPFMVFSYRTTSSTDPGPFVFIS